VCHDETAVDPPDEVEDPACGDFTMTPIEWAWWPEESDDITISTLLHVEGGEECLDFPGSRDHDKLVLSWEEGESLTIYRTPGVETHAGFGVRECDEDACEIGDIFQVSNVYPEFPDNEVLRRLVGSYGAPDEACGHVFNADLIERVHCAPLSPPGSEPGDDDVPEEVEDPACGDFTMTPIEWAWWPEESDDITISTLLLVEGSEECLDFPGSRDHDKLVLSWEEGESLTIYRTPDVETHAGFGVRECYGDACEIGDIFQVSNVYPEFPDIEALRRLVGSYGVPDEACGHVVNADLIERVHCAPLSPP
jgi:hypothetical protein